MLNKISEFIIYIQRLLKYHLGYENVQIIGLNLDEYPYIMDIVYRMLKIYNIKKMRVVIKKKGYTAGTFAFFGDRIIISKNLLMDLNVEELESVIAHEFAHAFYRDFFLTLTSRLLISIPLLYSLIRSSYEPNNPFNAVLFIFTLLIYIFGFRIINWMSVELEVLSDRDASLNVKNPDSLEKALFKMYIHHIEKKKRPSHLEIIFECIGYIKRYFIGETHPYLKERIEHIKFANEMREKVKKG